MGRREPGSFDVVLFPEFKEAVDANCGTEDAAGDVGGVCGFTIFCVNPRWAISCSQKQELVRILLPATHGVNVDAISAKYSLRHDKNEISDRDR